MLSLLLLLSQTDPLLDHKATMLPGGPGVSFYSDDGTEILQSQGASIARLSSQKLERCEKNGTANCPACDDQCLPTEPALPLEASIMAIVSSNNTPLGADATFVAGGDAGLFVYKRSTTGSFVQVLHDQSHPAGQTLFARWCTDVALSDDGSLLVATFGAQDDNELRVYSISSTTQTVNHLRTIPLDPGTVLPGEHLSVAWAVELYGPLAYVALGDAGIAEVDTSQVSTPNVQQRPGATPWNQMRDLAIVGNSMFVAADGQGMLEVDLTQTFVASAWNLVPFAASGCTSQKNYGIRVDALLDETAEGDQIVVSLATTKKPVRGVEGGPYRPYGNYTWNLGFWNNVDPLDPDLGCEDYLFLFVGPTTGTVTQVMALDGSQDQVVLDASPLAWESLDMKLGTDGRLWVISEELDVVSFVRSGPNWVKSTLDNSGAYVIHSSVAQGVFGLAPASEDYVFLGEDGGASEIGIQELVSLPAPAFVNHPDGTLKFPLACDSQWLDSTPDLEWITGGLGFVFRFNSSNPVGTIMRAQLTRPKDPSLDLPFMPYAFTAQDSRPGSDLFVQGGSRVSYGAAIYSRAEITGPFPTMNATPKAFLRTHPEPFATTEERRAALTLQLEIGSIRMTNGAQRRVLVAAAGSNVHDTPTEDVGWPLLAFFDMEGCSQPGQGMNFGFDSVTTLPGGLPGVTGRYAYGRTRSGMFFAVTMATIPMSLGDRSFVFAANTAGAIEAFSVSQLYDTPTSTAGYVTRSLLPVNLFDGHRDVPVDLVYVPGVAAGGIVGKLYCAASRLGLLSIEVLDVGGALKFGAQTVVNTPGSASGVAISTDAGGNKRLVVGDHEDYGYRAYGQL